MDESEVVGQAVRYVVPLIREYGADVLDRVRQTSLDRLGDAGTDTGIGLARRLWLRIIGGAGERPAVEAAVEDVAAYPDDAEALAALRLQLRKLLSDDRQLAAELAAMLPARPPTITARGERSVAAHTISGTVVTGDDATIHR